MLETDRDVLTMRRHIAWIVTLLTLVIVIGCSSGDNGNEAAEPLPIEHGETGTEVPSVSAPPAESEANEPEPSNAASPPPAGEVDEVSAMLSRMTVEEKIGQMLMIGVDGTSMDQTAERLIKDRHVGGVIFYQDNLKSIGDAVKLVNDLKAANDKGAAPLLLAVDQEGGKINRMPADFEAIPDSLTVGKSNDASLAKALGGLLADELRVMGLNLNFAPVLDINSNPKNPVIGVRSFGNSPEIVAKMGVAEMQGLQEAGVIAGVKHFPGHGDTSVDSHRELPVVRKSLEELQKFEWVPFQSAIEGGADVVMAAHILFPRIDNEVPASLSKIVIGDQLRGTLGFDGVVITDEMTMGAIANNYGIVNGSLKAILAGSDIVIVAHDYSKMQSVYDKLLKSAKDGTLSEQRIDESVRRILSLKLKYALSDEPTPIPTAADLPNAQIREWKTRLSQATAGQK